MPTPPDAAPVAAEAFARLVPDANAPLAVAFSGGGDSLALLLIARDWAAAHGRRLIAFTVDHGLQRDSGRWTEEAGEAAARAGVYWRPLHWAAPKPLTGVQEAARLARHRLLAAAARAEGARVILLGHTLDDVEEGERMGLRSRLRDWAPSPVWPEGRGVFLLRPLLRAKRQALRAWLTAQGWSWHEDPANADTRFARVRARLHPSPVAGEAEGAALPPSYAGALSLTQAERGFCVTPDGRICVERRAITGRFLSAALLCAGGGEVPPRGERLARLAERLQEDGDVTASLAGARVEADGETVVVGREAGERARGGLAPIPLRAGEAVVWDGRYLVEADIEDLTVEPMAGRMGDLRRNDRIRLKALPPAARSALPVLAGGLRAALPRPFGEGPGTATSLVQDRLRAALGLIPDESFLLS